MVLLELDSERVVFSILIAYSGSMLPYQVWWRIRYVVCIVSRDHYCFLRSPVDFLCDVNLPQ